MIQYYLKELVLQIKPNIDINLLEAYLQCQWEITFLQQWNHHTNIVFVVRFTMKKHESICLIHTVGKLGIKKCHKCDKMQPSEVEFILNYNLCDCALLIAKTMQTEEEQTIDILDGTGHIEYFNGDVYHGNWVIPKKYTDLLKCQIKI